MNKRALVLLVAIVAVLAVGGFYYFNNTLLKQKFFVFTSVVGSGSVQRSLDGSINDGSVVSFNAVPASGWKFSHWNGSATGTQNPLQLLVNSNKTLTATFTSEIKYKILIYSDEPDEGNYTFDNQPTVKALNNLGLKYTYSVFPPDFMDKLVNDGPWDLVIYKEEFQGGPSAVYDALGSYASAGRLIVSTYCIGRYSIKPLWAELGASFVSNGTFQSKEVSIWASGHQTVSSPNILTSPIKLNNVQYLNPAISYVNAATGATVIIGDSASSQSGKGLITVSMTGRGVFVGVAPSTMGQDQNKDGKTDATALWENLIQFVLVH
jgi:hypothetical protein